MTSSIKGSIFTTSFAATVGSMSVSHSVPWIFDSNMKFYVGSDVNSLNRVSCEIKDLKVLYV